MSVRVQLLYAQYSAWTPEQGTCQTAVISATSCIRFGNADFVSSLGIYLPKLPNLRYTRPHTVRSPVLDKVSVLLQRLTISQNILFRHLVLCRWQFTHHVRDPLYVKAQPPMCRQQNCRIPVTRNLYPNPPCKPHRLIRLVFLLGCLIIREYTRLQMDTSTRTYIQSKTTDM